MHLVRSPFELLCVELRIQRGYNAHNEGRLVKTPVCMFQSFEYWLLVANPLLNNLLQNQLVHPR